MWGKGWLVIIAAIIISLGLVMWGIAAEQGTTEKTPEPTKTKARTPKIKKIYLPENFRSWTHAKSMVILDKHPLYNPFGGIHHIYVKKSGLSLEAYKAGKDYPEGAVIVFDLYEAKLENGAYIEGAHKFTAIMVKNTKTHADTGGWGFEMFAGPNMEPQVKDAKKECFECHSQAKDRDYVYSQYTK